jgi:hypothetical protein
VAGGVVPAERDVAGGALDRCGERSQRQFSKMSSDTAQTTRALKDRIRTIRPPAAEII